MYIRHLKYCIGKMKGWSGPLYRGVDLSEKELQEMESLGTFFLPSFTSTSKDREKAFGTKSHVLIIDAADARWTLEMNNELSIFHATENEVLLSCYSLFKLKAI